MVDDRQAYVDAIESSVISMLTKAAVRVIVTRLPFLAWGPIAPVVAYVVEKLITEAVKEAELRIFFIYTDMRVSVQGKKFAEKAHDYHNNKTPETERAVIEAFRQLVCFTL